MSEISRITLFILLLASVVTQSEAQPATGPVRGPNILFVLIDDMGYADLGCFGGRRAKTPAIDRLASEGVRFTQFYVNAPICSPSRVAFLTGQYPNRWRITSFLETRASDRDRKMADWLDPAAPSIARILQGAGYHTAHVGKWHMGGQRDVGDAPTIDRYGFNTSLTSFEGLGERVLPVFKPLPGEGKFDHGPTRMSADLGGGPIHWVDRDKVSAAFVDRALVEIDVAHRAGKPFYLHVWPDDVHSPVQPPEPLRGDGSPADQYAGVLMELDRQLARLFDRIRGDEALRHNTLILLASDNGPERGLGSAGALRGSKGQLYEGGIREPLIAWGPGLIPTQRAGTTNDATIIAAMDYAPSLLSIAGIRTPADMQFDGEDLSAALLGDASARRKAPMMWLRPPDRPGPRNNLPDLAIRDQSWKLLIFRDNTRPELYDINADPNEKTNLAAKNPERVEAMARRVIEWDRAINASVSGQK